MKEVLQTEKERHIMKPLKRQLSMTLDEDIILEIKALAERDDRSFSQYVNMVLKRYLEESRRNSLPQQNGNL